MTDMLSSLDKLYANTSKEKLNGHKRTTKNYKRLKQNISSELKSNFVKYASLSLFTIKWYSSLNLLVSIYINRKRIV